MKVGEPMEIGRVVAKVLMRKRQAAISGRGRAARRPFWNVDFSLGRMCVTNVPPALTPARMHSARRSYNFLLSTRGRA